MPFAQHQRRPLHRLERRERPSQIDPVPGRRPLRRLGELGGRLPPSPLAPLPPELVDEQAPADRAEPGGEFGLASEARQRLPGLEERLLRQLVAKIGAGELGEEGAQPPLVAFHEQAERAFVALRCAAAEGGIGLTLRRQGRARPSGAR